MGDRKRLLVLVAMMASFLLPTSLHAALIPSTTSALSFEAYFCANTPQDPIGIEVGAGAFGDYLYVTGNDDIDLGRNTNGEIYKIDADCGTPSVFARGLAGPSDIGFDPTGVFDDLGLVTLEDEYQWNNVMIDAEGDRSASFKSGLYKPLALEFTSGPEYGNKIYVSDNWGKINRMSRGGAIEKWANRSLFRGTHGLAFDRSGEFGRALYSVENDRNLSQTQIMRYAPNGVATVFVRLPPGARSAAFGKGGDFGHDLYVAGGNSLYRVDSRGGVTVALSGLPGAAWGVAVANDGNSIYMSIPSKRQIIRIVAASDDIAPITRARVDGSRGDSGWFLSDVTVSLEAEDDEGGSGVAATEFSRDGIFWEPYAGPVVISDEGNSPFFFRSTDSAGNVEVAKSLEVHIDKSPPHIDLRAPSIAAQYLLRQYVTADWSVEDSVSGIATQRATVPSDSPLDTARVGEMPFVVTARDVAGNSIEVTRVYQVRYGFSGFEDPLDPDGGSLFNLGRTVPVKFGLYAADGAPVSMSTPPLFVAPVRGGVVGTELPAVWTGQATEGNLFRYDAVSDLYIFNLATKRLSNGVWRLRVPLDDGSSHSVLFTLR